jgi:hypothetical protein
MTTASPLASPGREARRLLGRGAGRRAAVLCAADALDPCLRQSGDGSRLRSHSALDLLKAAALDRVLAVHRYRPCPAATRLCTTRNSSSRSTRRAGSTTAAPRCTRNSLRRLRQNAALAELAETFLAGRTNVRVVPGDGALWPETSADGVYVNFAVARPADRWIEGLAPGGGLVFPLSVLGPKRVNSGGRHSDRGAALRIKRRTPTARLILCAPRENSRRIQMTWHACARLSTPAASAPSAA